MTGDTVFDEVGFALEEAEFLTKTTNRSHSVVLTNDGPRSQYIVMERDRAMATLGALVLETIRAEVN